MDFTSIFAAQSKDIRLVGGSKNTAMFAEAGELQRLFTIQIPVVTRARIPLLPVANFNGSQ
ncbi:hypothetical protein [Cedecea lapagei]|uniref:hypothetical protein n=1 Tax=Cedecea lapagei TaxID=158823 RepID=UPI000F839D23|nr:hypothetical protein [Cedecea lapagei]